MSGSHEKPLSKVEQLQQDFDNLMKEEEQLLDDVSRCIKEASDRAEGEKRALELYAARIDEVLRRIREAEKALSQYQLLSHDAEMLAFEYTRKLSTAWKEVDTEFIEKYLAEYRSREN